MEERTQGLEEGGGGGAKDLGVRDEVFNGRISRSRRKERKRKGVRRGGGRNRNKERTRSVARPYLTAPILKKSFTE